MTALRNAAQQALEALLTYEQYIQPLTNVFGGPRVSEEGSASAKVDAAITALRAALAEPQRKPLTLTDLQEALVYTNLIDRDAIEDPDGYDEGSTLAQIDELHRAIERAHGIGEKE